MAKKTTRSKSKSKKGKEPPPPPPEIIGILNQEDLETFVLNHKGSALLAVLSTLCPMCTDTVLPFLEKLNVERPDALATTNIAVLYADESTATICQELGVGTVPYFVSYSYGTVVQQFAGDNTEKAQLIATLAANAAAEEQQRRIDAGEDETAPAS